jgi:hypothetical protein
MIIGLRRSSRANRSTRINQFIKASTIEISTKRSNNSRRRSLSQNLKRKKRPTNLKINSFEL